MIFAFGPGHATFEITDFRSVKRWSLAFHEKKRIGRRLMMVGHAAVIGGENLPR